ncbi:WD40-repeat-containing domain protein [Lenzites betulinus]|nr:WD40-repeat-containing domain protein [Lenzites betulinus]
MSSAYQQCPSPIFFGSSITAVSFSPNARFLATATSDGGIWVWEIQGDNQCTVVCSASGDTTALAISWIQSSRVMFVYGTESGNVATCSFSHDIGTLHIHGFLGHCAPVNCISASLPFVATSAGGQLCVWKWRENEPWYEVVELPCPQTQGRDLEMLVTAIFWMPMDEESGTNCQLIGTYLHHGVCIYDSTSWACIRSFPLGGMAVSASISSDSKLLSILNLAVGYEIYSLQSGSRLRLFTHFGGRRASSSQFAENDMYLVCGGEQGEAYVWDIRTGQCVQTLSHYAHGKVLAVDVRSPHIVSQALIVTGVSDELNPYAALWFKGERCFLRHNHRRLTI